MYFYVTGDGKVCNVTIFKLRIIFLKNCPPETHYLRLDKQKMRVKIKLQVINSKLYCVTEFPMDTQRFILLVVLAIHSLSVALIFLFQGNVLDVRITQ